MPAPPAVPTTPRPVSPGAALAVGLALIGLTGLVAFGFMSRKEPELDNAMAIRDFGRGSLEVNETTLKVAYAIEGVIIAAALYAGWQFANRYASDNWDLWIMAVVGAIAICAAETARIFLAKAVRTQTTTGMKVLATIGLICMCLVTTKTMATVMEQTYNPRLRQVVQANDEVKLAEGDLATIVAKREAEKLPLAQLEADVKAAEEEIKQLNERISEQGAAPADREKKVPYKSPVETSAARPSVARHHARSGRRSIGLVSSSPTSCRPQSTSAPPRSPSATCSRPRCPSSTPRWPVRRRSSSRSSRSSARR